MRKIFEGIAHFVAWTSIIGMIFLVWGFLFWSFYPYKTIIIHNEPVPVENKDGKVALGSSLKLHLKWDKFTPVGADISRMLLNKKTREMVVIYSGSSAVPPGEHDKTISVPIPTWVPLGRFILITTYEYQVNPLRKIPVSWKSQEFEIVEFEGGGK